MILKQIAQKISEDTTKIIGFPVSISDENGYLIGVNDESRLGLFDNLFSEVIEKEKFIYFNENSVKDFPNIFPGVAAPLKVNQKIIGAVGIIGKTGKDIETKNYIHLVKNHIEMMCHEVINKEIKSLESHSLETLIQYILNFNNLKHDEKNIIRYGEMLGYNLNIYRTCLIIQISKNIVSNEQPNSLHMQDEILDILIDHFMEHKEDMVGRLTFEQFCILKYVKTVDLQEREIEEIRSKTEVLNKTLQEKYDVCVHVSIGDIGSGINGIQNSYYNALQTLEVNMKLDLHKRVYNYNDLTNKLNIIINTLPTNFFDRIKPSIEPLITHENFEILTNTFIVYCESKFNLSDAARNLFIHRNSLIYRLNQFTKLTNINLTDFNHCVLIYLYLKINEINN